MERNNKYTTMRFSTQEFFFFSLTSPKNKGVREKRTKSARNNQGSKSTKRKREPGDGTRAKAGRGVRGERKKEEEKRHIYQRRQRKIAYVGVAKRLSRQ